MSLSQELGQLTGHMTKRSEKPYSNYAAGVGNATPAAQGPHAANDFANNYTVNPNLPGFDWHSQGSPSNSYAKQQKYPAHLRRVYQNVAVPGGGGSAWGDEVVGRGGVHPDSVAAKHINSQFGAEKGPISSGRHWEGIPGGARSSAWKNQQAIHGKRMLAQDPRGAGGWAYRSSISPMGYIR